MQLSVVEKKMLGRKDLDRYATQLLSSSPPSTAECVKEFQAFPPGRAGICQFPGAGSAGLFSDAPLGRNPLPVFAGGVCPILMHCSPRDSALSSL